MVGGVASVTNPQFGFRVVLAYGHARSHYTCADTVRELAHIQYHHHFDEEGGKRANPVHLTFFASDSCSTMLGAMVLGSTPFPAELAAGV